MGVARETPLVREARARGASACAAVCSVPAAVRNSPRLLYHLAVVQCLVWIGNTAWNIYGQQWFTHSVFHGDQNAPEGSKAKAAYGEGVDAFSFGGQLKSVLQLFSTLLIISILLKTSVRPRSVYAPCIYIGAVVSMVAAFLVGHSAVLAIICMMVSIMPETGSFAIPFGLVATLNKRAQLEGKPVSTALQMALLNCCVTVGQQICTLVLAGIEGKLSLEQALPCVFMLASGAQLLGGTSALFLNDRPVEEDAPVDMDDERNLDGPQETSAKTEG